MRGRCYSPTSCNGFGYCRARNEGIAPTDYEMQTFRLIAADRKAKEECGNGQAFPTRTS